MNVLSHPNAALKQLAQPVDPATDTDLRELCRKMAQAMYDAPGIGLAAPQIGVLKRVIIYDLDDEGAGVVALCNPKIVESGEEREFDDEGCLSLPGITVPVERSCTVVCEAQTLTGRVVRIEADGLHARLLQHEIDHLDGVLMIDRATPEERKAALRRYLDAQLAGAKPGQTSI
ncbi:MAG: peptide deformylase [Coriobacteriia bacterium]